jgi:hypothetical protein
MMVMGKRTHAAQQQEAHKATKKLPEMRSPRKCGTGTHGHDV